MSRQVIHTENAPAAIGTYSQAILVGDTLYLSGQIGLDPYSMELVEGIEHTNQKFCIGVQWHPEYEVTPADFKIIQAFVDACK